jgi:hypothetical protein
LREISVSSREREKILYAKGVFDAAERMQSRYKHENYALMMNEGVALHRRVDWRRVANECAPDVLLVMAHDGTRKDEVFDEFPVYILIPRLGDYFALSDEVAFSIEEAHAPQREEVVRALNLLKQSATLIDGAKSGNAIKLLSGLHKLLLG